MNIKNIVVIVKSRYIAIYREKGLDIYINMRYNIYEGGASYYQIRMKGGVYLK